MLQIKYSKDILIYIIKTLRQQYIQAAIQQNKEVKNILKKQLFKYRKLLDKYYIKDIK